MRHLGTHTRSIQDVIRSSGRSSERITGRTGCGLAAYTSNPSCCFRRHLERRSACFCWTEWWPGGTAGAKAAMLPRGCQRGPSGRCTQGIQGGVAIISGVLTWSLGFPARRRELTVATTRVGPRRSWAVSMARFHASTQPKKARAALLPPLFTRGFSIPSRSAPGKESGPHAC